MGRIIIFPESEDAEPGRNRSSQRSQLARLAHHNSSRSQLSVWNLLRVRVHPILNLWFPARWVEDTMGAHFLHRKNYFARTRMRVMKENYILLALTKCTSTASSGAGQGRDPALPTPQTRERKEASSSVPVELPSPWKKKKKKYKVICCNRLTWAGFLQWKSEG